MNKPKAVRVWMIDMHVALHQRKPKHGQAKPYILVPSSLYRKMRRELRETKAKLEATLKGIGHANSQHDCNSLTTENKRWAEGWEFQQRLCSESLEREKNLKAKLSEEYLIALENQKKAPANPFENSNTKEG